MSREESEQFKIDLSQCRTNWSTGLKVRRGLWQFLIKPFYRLLPTRQLRILVLRLCGARIGDHCNIQHNVDILMPWNLELGDYVALAHHTRILNFATVRIDSMTVVSQYSHLCTGTHDTSDPHFELKFTPIHIEAECWIASGAFIGPGVHIGRGTVIGANSVANKDMPAWKVCAGNPCQPLKERIVRSNETPPVPRGRVSNKR